MSISGISGVAAKTSYALFLLYMMLESEQGRALLGPAAAQTRALVFNVKGEDLLHLDKPHRDLNEERRAQWAALGIPNPMRLYRVFRSVDSASFVDLLAPTGHRSLASIACRNSSG